MKSLLNKLRLPENSGADLDAPQTTLIHSRIIQSKPFLKNIYFDFYRMLQVRLDGTMRGLIVELGSGGGFIKEVIPPVKNFGC